MPKNSSLIAFEAHNNKTKLVRQLSIKPLKIVNTQEIGNSSFCMLTNYGGGFVQGDKIELNVICGENSKSVISSQANTRVYEGDGKECHQKLVCEVKKGAFHAFLNDPLVMHKGGKLDQEVQFHLDPDSTAVYLDWFSAGRLSRGESYDFDFYKSSCRFMIEEKPVLWDNFVLDPKRHDIKAPNLLGSNISFVNLFVVGDPSNSGFVSFKAALLDLSVVKYANLEIGLADVEERAFILRIVSNDIIALKKLVQSIINLLSHPQFVGADPWERKY